MTPKKKIQFRILIENGSLIESKKLLIRFIQETARDKLWQYAQKHRVIDFNDPILTRTRDETFRQTIIDLATTAITNTNNSTTVSELLIIFDNIAI